MVLFVAYLCSATNGFDSNTFGGASAMSSFQNFFSVHGGSKQGLLAASYVIGNMVRRVPDSDELERQSHTHDSLTR